MMNNYFKETLNLQKHHKVHYNQMASTFGRPGPLGGVLNVGALMQWLKVEKRQVIGEY